MVSVAISRFQQQMDNAEKLRQTQTSKNQNIEKQIYYQASLAATVAAWDSYIKAVTNEFISKTFSRSSDSFYLIIHNSLQIQFKEKTKRLNTPSFDNARNYILEFTGYDPIADWGFPKLNWSHFQVKNRLEEILKVRHSFAHGFPTPPLPWTTSTTGGGPRLKLDDMKFNELIITHLVKTTDSKLEIYLSNNFGLNF
ncbi:HEPN domain-containing protein [Ectopseudomonas mendocina]|uniref:HEPN domain-containing protein n=1 Tax=Ectopseudomonas mendocina TaxID=300 RepID=UPI0023EB4458|nr:HEPN domain-containing protein [Pseudomonas mendocina]